MDRSKIIFAKLVADRFLTRAGEVMERLDKDPMMSSGCKETAALRRASLDLTRALAQMRKP